MKMPENCPVCGGPMPDDPEYDEDGYVKFDIGPCCVNPECPVGDGALLWFRDLEGKWTREEQAWEKISPFGSYWVRDVEQAQKFN